MEKFVNANEPRIWKMSNMDIRAASANNRPVICRVSYIYNGLEKNNFDYEQKSNSMPTLVRKNAAAATTSDEGGCCESTKTNDDDPKLYLRLHKKDLNVATSGDDNDGNNRQMHCTFMAKIAEDHNPELHFRCDTHEEVLRENPAALIDFQVHIFNELISRTVRYYKIDVGQFTRLAASSFDSHSEATFIKLTFAPSKKSTLSPSQIDKNMRDCGLVFAILANCSVDILDYSTTTITKANVTVPHYDDNDVAIAANSLEDDSIMMPIDDEHDTAVEPPAEYLLPTNDDQQNLFDMFEYEEEEEDLESDPTTSELPPPPQEAMAIVDETEQQNVVEYMQEDIAAAESQPPPLEMPLAEPPVEEPQQPAPPIANYYQVPWWQYENTDELLPEMSTEEEYRLLYSPPPPPAQQAVVESPAPESELNTPNPVMEEEEVEPTSAAAKHDAEPDVAAEMQLMEAHDEEFWKNLEATTTNTAAAIVPTTAAAEAIIPPLPEAIAADVDIRQPSRNVLPDYEEDDIEMDDSVPLRAHGRKRLWSDRTKDLKPLEVARDFVLPQIKRQAVQSNGGGATRRSNERPIERKMKRRSPPPHSPQSTLTKQKRGK